MAERKYVIETTDPARAVLLNQAFLQADEEKRDSVTLDYKGERDVWTRKPQGGWVLRERAAVPAPLKSPYC